MFAFLVLSTSPGFEIKSLAVGMAAGIIFDATVIRALLVPALMTLFGAANWWMPSWAGVGQAFGSRGALHVVELPDVPRQPGPTVTHR